MKRTIDNLRECIRDQRYLISVHANTEMSDDDLTSVDLENAILTGKIARRFTKVPRGHAMRLLVKRATADRLQWCVGGLTLVGLE